MSPAGSRARSRARRLALIGTSVAVAASTALTAATASTADASEAAAAAGSTITVYVARTHTIAMPVRMRPGVHEFVVSSARRAGFQIVKAAPGYSKSDLARDVNLGMGQGRLKPLERFERNVTLLGGVDTSRGNPGVMWVNLRPGTYWVADTSSNITAASKILTFRVGTDHLTGGVRPTAEVSAVREATWAAPRTIGHRGRLLFSNDSKDNHFIEMARLAPGKTMADFRDWIGKAAKGVDAPPPVDLSAKELSTGVLSPGKKMVLPYDLPKGRYVLICWWPDTEMGGMPHAFMGMYRGIRLT